MNNPRVFLVLRNTSFNNTLLERERVFGTYSSREEASKASEAFSNDVAGLDALDGLSFTFYVKDERVRA